MCEANVFMTREDGGEELLMDNVDLVEFQEEEMVRLVSIFGDQLALKARIRTMSLANHRILLERA
jgi:predicted RNA-binding protein